MTGYLEKEELEEKVLDLEEGVIKEDLPSPLNEEIRLKKTKAEKQQEKLERIRQDLLKASKDLRDLKTKEAKKIINSGKKALILTLDEKEEIEKDINFIYLLGGVGEKISRLTEKEIKDLIDKGKEKIILSNQLGVKLKKETLDE